jgi:putative membrane protein
MRESIGHALALVNALLNGTSALLLVAGRVAIWRRKVPVHRALMLSAFAASALFLASYLTRVALTGTHRDPHTGFFHVAYLAILFSHMTLAVLVVPLVFASLAFALKKRFDRHRRVARLTFPVWLYVSVTGVAVYVMLYVVPS